MPECLLQNFVGGWNSYGSKYQDNQHLVPFRNNVLRDRGILPEFQDLALDLISSNRARSSWKQCRTVLNKISEISQQFNIDLSLPWDHPKRLNFCLALLRQGLKVSSVKNYLSQTNTLHRLAQFECPGEDHLLASFLRGGNNIEAPSRKVLAITPSVLHLIRDRLKTKTDTLRVDRKMIWTCVMWMYFGAMRVNECLSEGSTSHTAHDLTGDKYKVETTRLDNRDVSIIVLTLTCPKETRGMRNSAEIELFEQGNRLCPVSAFKSWRNDSTLPISKDRPIFRWANGKSFTRANLQSLLKELIGDLETDLWRVSTHGLRAGLPTTLGLMGESEEVIAQVGRWKSEAWRSYLRFGRGQRFSEAMRLAEKMKEATSFSHRNLVGVLENEE